MDDQALERYSRQLLVPGFELEGQERLLQAKVLVVGCGGLGALAAQYLAGAGVGRLLLVDPDIVEISNLPRQIAYTEADLGLAKSEVLARRLLAMNSSLRVEYKVTCFDETTGPELLAGVDAVLDGTDSHATRQLLDRLTAAAGLPWFMGAAVQMAGQSIAFSGQRAEGCYHCLAPAASAEWGGGCAALGILGPVVGMVALQQTLDLINALSHAAPVPWGVLRQFDFRTGDRMALTLQRRPGCELCCDKPEGTAV